MARRPFVAVSIAAGIWGAVFAAPTTGNAEPPSISCTAEMYANGSCVYANCTEAEAAGVCDIHEGDPAYCTKQDRDRDGIACECTNW